MEVSVVRRETAGADKSLLVIQMAMIEHMPRVTEKYHSQ
jgi:hypothetical protein